MLLLLSALATASAGDPDPFVLKVGRAVEVPDSASWVKAFPDGETGWKLVHSGGGDLLLRTMNNDLEMTSDPRPLTGLPWFIDQSIAACPDGGYLHVSSVNMGVPNGSAYAVRYDDDFEIIDHGWLAENHPTRAHNDAPAICDEGFEGAIFIDRGGGYTVFMEIGENGRPDGEHLVDHGPNSTGSSMVYEAETDTYVLASYPIFDEWTGYEDRKDLEAPDFDHNLYLFRLSRDFEMIEQIALPVAPEGDVVFWPMGMVRVGQVYVVVHVLQQDGVEWRGDSGDLALAIFDLDWTLLDTVPITDHGGGEGSNRPQLALRGDTLLVTYDDVTKGRVRALTLDLARAADPHSGAAGVDSGGADSGRADSGGVDSAPGGDSDPPGGADSDPPAPDTGEAPEGAGGGGPVAPTVSGCAAAAGGGLWWLAALAGAARRRRR